MADEPGCLSQIDGRKAGAYGTIDAEGLSGDPLGKMHLRRLAVRDARWRMGRRSERIG
jgi:hypothetical protein